MTTLRMLMGPPGAGKTTWCRRHAAELGTVLSFDQARAIVGAGEHDQAATPAAVEWVHDQARAALSNGGDVTIDATGTKPHPDRARVLELAHAYDTTPIAVIVRTPLGVCLRRNVLRERIVPTPVVCRMWRAVHDTTPAQLEREGFAQVHTVHDSGTDDAAVDDRDWCYAAELQPGQLIDNPDPGPAGWNIHLQVSDVSGPDDHCMVTITPHGAPPISLAADWGISLAASATGKHR